MLKILKSHPIRVPVGELMGRFHRSRAASCLVWAPRQSAVRIEYSNEVVREAGRLERGVLYGTRKGATVRVAAARREQSVTGDPRLAGLDLLGTFASRPRGEVFLTDPDIQHLELTGGSIALVVAATKAGFFVYEPDGTIQTIKSYQEFSIAPWAPAPKTRKPRTWWIAAACAALILASASAMMWRDFTRTRPLGLILREDADQLRISWNRNAFRFPARLEIADGSQRDWIPVNADLASATYVRRTGDVQVRLIAGARSETAHFVGGEPSYVVREDVARLESEASRLRGELESRQERASLLQKRIQSRLK